MYTKDLRDQMIIVQSENGSDDFDNFDAYKRFDDDTSRAALYTFTPELYKVVIQTVKPVTTEKIFPIGLFNTFPTKSFRFEADFRKASTKYNYFLEDTKLGTTQDLKQNPNYTFTAEFLKDSLGTRFKLHVLLAPKVVAANSVSICSPAKVDLTASSVTQGSDNGLTFTYWLDPIATQLYTTPTSADAGTYYIKGTAPNGSYSISSPIVVTVNPSPTVITTNPAPVVAPATVDLTKPEIILGSTDGLSYSYWLDASATLAYPTPQTAAAGNYYIMGTIDLTGCFAIAGPVEVIITTGIPVDSEKGVHIFSYDNQIFVDHSLPNSVITIYDLLGRQLYYGISKSDREIITINSITGLYIVRVVNAQTVKSQKVYLR
jgi:hypothetical protein